MGLSAEAKEHIKKISQRDRTAITVTILKLVDTKFPKINDEKRQHLISLLEYFAFMNAPQIHRIAMEINVCQYDLTEVIADTMQALAREVRIGKKLIDEVVKDEPTP